MAKRKKTEGATVPTAVDTPAEPQQSRELAREERSDALDTAIAKRAYQIYRERGGTDGRALDDWLQAEAELSSRRRGGPTRNRQA
jgi:hypothetical protein